MNQNCVFSCGQLAVMAAERGDGERAGLLWGAVDAEAASGRVGQWERERPEFEAIVRTVDGPAFRRAHAEGGLLSIAQAIAVEPALAD